MHKHLKLQIKNACSYECGFSLIEALTALAMSGVVISGCLFLAGESSNQASKRIQGAKAYLALQNLSEQLLVSNGANGSLDEGDHGPIYYDTNGRAASTGPVSVTWNVKLNDPSQNVMKIESTATWSSSSSSKGITTSLVLYRSIPLLTTTTTVETLSLPTPTPTPAPSPTYFWASWSTCDTTTHIAYWTYLCRASSGPVKYVADSYCPQPKPSSTTEGCGNITYQWVTGSWEQSCSDGTHGRAVYCQSSDGKVMTDPVPCPESSKPAETEACASCYPFCK